MIPFVFVLLLAFASDHPQAPSAAVKAMAMCLLVGIPHPPSRPMPSPVSSQVLRPAESSRSAATRCTATAREQAS